MKKERFKWVTKGKALPENIVQGKNYRFTILTSRLIRLEYDTEGIFEDRATQSFFYRDFEKNVYTFSEKDGIITIKTTELTITYHKDEPFQTDTLSVCLENFPKATWHYGEEADQLKGTASTLDNTNGTVALEEGVISRNGYAVIDDSESMVLTDEGWFDIRREGVKDIYFFGYGHAYLDCLKDFYRITGVPPLLPDYALGNLWCRYYAYTQQEYCELMERFEREQIPFSVGVVDMDWHTVEDVPENRIDDSRYKPGWTGYTWNTELFPDYKEFLKFMKEHNLKTALNLHPAQGVGCNEVQYEEMAKGCGVDPTSKKPVKFDCLNPDFMEKYFDILHHPYEEDGVDFWWMDWQQGTDYWWIHDSEHPESPLEKMNPLWLLNHLHVLDISRSGKRPMFFSRYSGIGSHRYPVGFSGDVVTTWRALDFQPYFTANASNVGYSWWSHDIGGTMRGAREDELTIRWMQLGVFSPINRLHASTTPFSGKEPWKLFPYEAEIARKWLRFRHRLFPYIYTMNYRNHTELIPLVLPMYYSHPEKEAAYQCPNQYWFGSELIVSPITERNDACTRLGRTKVWLPEGEWIDAFNGYVYRGDKEIEVYRNLEQMPIFAKAGAVVPMQVYGGDNKLGRRTDMEVYVFAGADNSFTMYEDAGDYNDYQNGEFVNTKIDLNWSQNAVITIHAAQGEVTLIPKQRNWTVRFRGDKKPNTIKAIVSGKEQVVDFEYDESCATVTVVLKDIAVTSNVELIFVAEDSLLYDNHGARERILDMLIHAQMAYHTKNVIWEHMHKKSKGMFLVCGESEHQAVLGFIEEMLMLEREGN
ncbi:MAG: DUF5110 domain-containing protein [Tyzzerella sp.]|nr:DUF5110 domain-containing protein [Tyzzerella sp.]